MADFLKAGILQCENPLHHWNYTLKSSFTKSWIRVTMKFWSSYQQYLQSCLEIFIHHLAAAVPFLETDNISPVCRYIFEIWPVLMACTWKIAFCLHSLAVFWDKILIFHFGQRDCLARGDCPFCTQHHALISSFDVVLPSERKKPSGIHWTIEISPSKCWVLLS